MGFLRTAARTAPLACLVLLASRLTGEDRRVDDLSLEELMQIKVQTASLHTQAIESAPAIVTVVTADEIRKFGYRTFAEVLNHVRGIYLAYDHTYYQLGIGGFAIPGDWSTRILILVNGHAMPDNVFGTAAYYGDDFPIDISLVDRVEVVRGPSSALYGSNGILATINVILRKPGKTTQALLRAETSSIGERILTVSQTMPLGKGRSLLVSGSVFNSLGQRDIYVSEYDTPETNNGHAIDMDNSRGYRMFAGFNIGNWELMAVAASREKIQPLSWGDTIFNDRGSRATDQRSFFDALYTKEISEHRVLRWRTFYDGYRFIGNYRYRLEDGGVDTNREFDAGDWVGSQLTYRFAFAKGHLTAGGESKVDLRALQSVQDVLPVYQELLRVNRRDRYAAGFLQQEWELGPKLSFNLGTRYDWSMYRSSSVSPRAAIIYQPDKTTSVKFIYGRGFRNPNANELFFDDGDQNRGNSDLRPETADNFELAFFRDLNKNWMVGITTSRMKDRDIIVPTYTDDGLTKYINADQFRSYTMAMELAGKFKSGVELKANFQKQHAYMDGGIIPANSPSNVGKFRLGVPLLSSKMMLSTGLLYVSRRNTLAGAVLPAVFLPEATVSTRGLSKGFDVQFGIRNLSNHRYSDPIGLSPTVDTLRQVGRTYFFTLTRHFGGADTK